MLQVAATGSSNGAGGLLNPAAVKLGEDFDLITLKELGQLAKQSRTTLDRRRAAGELTVVVLPHGQVRVTVAEARRYLHGQPHTGNGQDSP